MVRPGASLHRAVYAILELQRNNVLKGIHDHVLDTKIELENATLFIDVLLHAGEEAKLVLGVKEVLKRPQE